MEKTKTETSTKTTYIVKRNYTNDRTGTDVFVKLLTKKHRESIGYTQQNIDNTKKICYTEDSFRERCVIPKNPKEE